MEKLNVTIRNYNSGGANMNIWIEYGNVSYVYDKSIAAFLGMTLNNYHNLINDKLKCKIIEKENSKIYFNDIIEIEKIKVWLEENIECYLIMKELSPNSLIGE